MNQRCAKTDAGRDEIKNRSRKLSRPARNLLLVMDTTHTAQEWLHLVHGVTEEDLQQLLAEGLIEGKDDPQAPRAGVTASLADALARLPYDQLYSLLTSQARERFGLIKGYKMVLEVEKCANIDELRALALRFLDLVKEQQGDAVYRQMRMALGVQG